MDAFRASLYSARCLAEVCTFAGCLVEKCKRRLNKRNHLVVSKKMRNFAMLYKQLKNRRYNMMLGMNAPKAVAKGEYAKAIRKAVHDSIEAIKNGKVPEKKNQKFNFEWRV